MTKETQIRTRTKSIKRWLPVAGISLLFLALLLVLAPPADAQGAPAFPAVFNVPDGFQPEGIAVGRGSSFYVGSLLHGGIYGGDLRTGAGEMIVPPQEGRIAVGLDVDQRSNAIFVAGGGPGLAPVPGAGYIYDIATGQELAAYDFNGGFVNDVIVTRTAAYFTDSLRPFLYKVPLGPQGQLPDPAAVEEIPLSNFDFNPAAFPNANGIVATADGQWLIVANTAAAAVYRVDPQTGEATKIDLGGEAVPRADGLVLSGKTLYVVQNFLNQIGVVSLDPSLTSGVLSDEPLTSSDYQIPTTAAKFGNTIYAINARFDTPPAPDVTYTVVGIPAR